MKKRLSSNVNRSKVRIISEYYMTLNNYEKTRGGFVHFRFT